MLRRHFIINANSGILYNKIWYTSSDGNIVTPNKASSLPTIVSNTYSNGKGVIKFKTDVTNIGADAFSYCDSLTAITIPNSVTSIGHRAFDYCSSLTSVIIGNSVISIGDNAFINCDTLTSITFEGTIAQWDAITKGDHWNTNVPATVVHCTDGDVEI